MSFGIKASDVDYVSVPDIADDDSDEYGDNSQPSFGRRKLLAGENSETASVIRNADTNTNTNFQPPPTRREGQVYSRSQQASPNADGNDPDATRHVSRASNSGLNNQNVQPSENSIDTGDRNDDNSSGTKELQQHRLEQQQPQNVQSVQKNDEKQGSSGSRKSSTAGNRNIDNNNHNNTSNTENRNQNQDQHSQTQTDSASSSNSPPQTATATDSNSSASATATMTNTAENKNGNNEINKHTNEGKTKVKAQTKNLVKWLRNRLRNRLAEVADLEQELNTENIMVDRLNKKIFGTYEERQREIKLKLYKQKKLKQFEKTAHGPDIELQEIENEKRILSEQLERVTRTYETLAHVDHDLRKKLHTAGLSHWLSSRGKEYMPETAVGVLARSAQILQPVTVGLERAAYEVDTRIMQAAGAVREDKFNGTFNGGMNDNSMIDYGGSDDPYYYYSGGTGSLGRPNASNPTTSWGMLRIVLVDVLMLIPFLPILVVLCRVRKALVGNFSAANVSVYISGVLTVEMFILAIASLLIGSEVIYLCQKAAFASAPALISEDVDIDSITEMDFVANSNNGELLVGVGSAIDTTISFFCMLTGTLIFVLLWTEVIMVAVIFLKKAKASTASGKIYNSYSHHHHQNRSERERERDFMRCVISGTGTARMQAEVVQMGLLLLVGIHFWKHVFTPIMTGATVVTTCITAHFAYAAVFACICQKKRTLLGWHSTFDKSVTVVGVAFSAWTIETVSAMRNVFNDSSSSLKMASGVFVPQGGAGGAKNGELSGYRSTTNANQGMKGDQDRERDDATSFMSRSSLPSRTDFTSSSSSSSSPSNVSSESFSATSMSMTTSTSMVSSLNDRRRMGHATITNGRFGKTGTFIGVPVGRDAGPRRQQQYPQETTIATGTTGIQELLTGGDNSINNDHRNDEAREAAAAAARYARWNGQNAWPMRQSPLVNELPWYGVEVHGRVAMARSRRLEKAHRDSNHS